MSHHTQEDINEEKTRKVVFARNIARLMRAASVSQKTLARAMGKSTRTVRRWENPSDQTWPQPQDLPVLARTLSCSIDDLYSFESEWLPQDTAEREILKVVRKNTQNLPVHLIARAVSTLLLKMDRAERENWIENGNLIVRRK